MFQYNEDVKALARQAGLKIVDSTVAVDRVKAAEQVPGVTIKAEYAERSMYASGERVPTLVELLAARDQLMERERELNGTSANSDWLKRRNASMHWAPPTKSRHCACVTKRHACRLSKMPPLPPLRRLSPLPLRPKSQPKPLRHKSCPALSG